MYISRVSIPEREEIEPIAVAPKKKWRLAINIKKIYEYDLFETYIKELPEITKRELSIPLPEPPQPQKVSIPEIPPPQFLDPLDITLKGIIVVGSNEVKNRAILQDNKTKHEDTYKVGNTIEDAQLIRIFRNKVVFLRSNGQQEVLYLREQDAKLDPAYTLIDGWDSVVHKISEHEYQVDPKEFVHRVKSLGQIIDMLGLTTSYQKGTNIGVRIGILENKSLGIALGLKTSDIIQRINDMPATSTENRLEIYKNITSKKAGETIRVKLLRNKQQQTINYTLQDFELEQQDTAKRKEKAQTGIKLLKEQKKENILKQKYKFAPTVQEIRKKERRMMFEKGKATIK